MEKEFAAFLLWSQSPTKKNWYTQYWYCWTGHFYLKLSYITKYWYVPSLYPDGIWLVNYASTIFSLQTLQLNNKDIIHQFREIPDSALNFLWVFSFFNCAREAPKTSGKPAVNFVDMELHVVKISANINLFLLQYLYVRCWTLKIVTYP